MKFEKKLAQGFQRRSSSKVYTDGQQVITIANPEPLAHITVK